MKRFLPALIVFTLLLKNVGVSRSADFQKCVEAYNKSDYVTALRKWTLLAEQGIELRVDREVVDILAAEGYEPEYGARPLRRVIRRRLENPLATELLEENFQDVHSVRVKPDSEGSKSLVFPPEDYQPSIQ